MMLHLYYFPTDGESIAWLESNPAGDVKRFYPHAEHVCAIPDQYAPRTQAEWEWLAREMGICHAENYEFKTSTAPNMKEKVFIIIGLPTHGKTEVAKGINYATKLRRSSCSGRIFAYLAAEIMTQTGKDLNTVWAELKAANKESIRPKLIALGDYLVSSEPARLVTELVAEGVRIVDGVRRKEELKLAREILTKKGFDVEVWWVKRVPEPTFVPDNTDVTEADADMVIENDTATVEELWAWIKDFLTSR